MTARALKKAGITNPREIAWGNMIRIELNPIAYAERHGSLSRNAVELLNDLISQSTFSFCDAFADEDRGIAEISVASCSRGPKQPRMVSVVSQLEEALARRCWFVGERKSMIPSVVESHGCSV
jgi:hypothetical protein